MADKINKNPYDSAIKADGKKPVKAEPVFDLNFTEDSKSAEAAAGASKKDEALKFDFNPVKKSSAEMPSGEKTGFSKEDFKHQDVLDEVINVKEHNAAPDTESENARDIPEKRSSKSKVKRISGGNSKNLRPDSGSDKKADKKPELPSDKPKAADKAAPAKASKEKSASAKTKKAKDAEADKKSAETAKLSESTAAAEASQQKPVKKISVFTKGILIYSGVLITAAVIVLIVLYNFLNAYEHSRPLNCINDYIVQMETGEFSEGCNAAFELLDENIKSREDSEAYIRELLPQLKIGKSNKLSTPENPAYLLTYEKQPLGTVYLKAMDEHPFDFTFWEIDHDEFDFSPIAHSHTLTLPSDYKVVVNGYELGSEYIVKDDIEYEMLSNFYEYYDDLPKMVTYESGKYLGAESLQILDSKGSELSPEQLNETYYLNNSTVDEIKNVSYFTEDFVNRYVRYTANLGGAWFYNYIQAKNLTVPGSQLSNRLHQAIGSFGYSIIYSCDITSNVINICYKHGDGYIVDLTYVMEVVARKGPVPQTINMRIALVPNEDGFLAEYMFNY